MKNLVRYIKEWQNYGESISRVIYYIELNKFVILILKVNTVSWKRLQTFM